MDFAFGQTVIRQRPTRVWNAISQTWVNGDWDSPDEVEIPGAFVAQSSTSRISNETRTQMLEAKSLYCDPNSDVLATDRIRVGEDVFPIDGIPTADVNPFSGWQPVREIPLKRAVG